MKKTYIEFNFNGKTVLEETLNLDPLIVKVPNGCYGFRFLNRTELQLREEKLVGNSCYLSGMFYIGIKKTLDQIKRERTGQSLNTGEDAPDCDMVEDRYGGYHNLCRGDVVLRSE